MVLNPASCAIRATMLLLRLPGVGPAAYWDLLEHFERPQRVLEASPGQLSQQLPAAACSVFADYQRRGDASELAQRVETDLAWLAEHQVQLLSAHDSDYPELLKEATRPPPLLYLKGNRQCLHTPQIAVVGSRKPTPAGWENAQGFSAFLAQAGFTITSGLALGVDSAAHQGALNGRGNTIAVLGTGIDTIYPARNRNLASQIVEGGGLLVSEFPLGTGPQPGNFPQRNRIISGLSLGVLVVEAAPKSGSLITARFALQQNREVFAIPGSIHNPMSRGCHSLIREGATLVETAGDMLEELGGLLAFKGEGVSNTALLNQAAPPVSEEEKRILDCLGYDPVGMDSLIQRLGVDVGYLSAQLLHMEIKGLVSQTPLGYQRSVSEPITQVL